MANALVGRKNLLDITYYPVILTRGSWESSLPLANLKDPLLVNAAQSMNAAKASTQWEVDFSVPREIKTSVIPRHNLRQGARYRKRYSDTPNFIEDLTVNGGHAIGATSISLEGGSGSIAVHTNDYITFGSGTDVYKVTGDVTVPGGGTASITITPALVSGLSDGMDVVCRTGNYDAPLRDTGWVDVWRVVYPWGTLPYGHPSFFTGTLSAEDIARTVMPIIDISPTSLFARYVLIELDDINNDDGYTRIPRHYVSSGWQPTINIAYGLRKGRVSNTLTAGPRGGAAFYDVRPNQRRIGFNLNNIEFDEAMRNVEEIHEQLDVHEQLFFVLDPDDDVNLHRNAFLCTLEKIDEYDYPYYRRINAPFNLIEVLE